MEENREFILYLSNYQNKLDTKQKTKLCTKITLENLGRDNGPQTNFSDPITIE